MRFALLGPLEVIDDTGARLPLSGPRLRVLLSALLLHANTPVSLDTLADVLWDGSPPPGEIRTLRSHVARLRRALGPRVGARIAACGSGYVLHCAEHEFDVLEFEALCRAAATALRAGAWSEASTTAMAAQGLWRAVPLLDVPGQELRDEFVGRFEQLRLQALEDRIEADIRLGHHDRLVPELRRLVAQYPLRERFHANLMMSLARAGRQAEALEAYRDVRGTLVEELGIEPGPELRALHNQILSGDIPPPASSDFAGGGVRGSADGAVRVVPRQLPAAVAHFTGRAELLKTLDDLAGRTAQARTRKAVVITAIDGTPGVGKTALAVHWGQQAADSFPDGQLYVNLRGFDPSGRPMEPAEAVRVFLDALGVRVERIPADPDAQFALYRSLLAGRRMLIVLDNARDADQVRPLLPGGSSCLALVTSRDRLAGLVALEGAHPLTVGLLSAGESLDLLHHRLGADCVAREPTAAGELITLCARLPLALNIAAARAALRPGRSLGAVVEELRDARDRLSALDLGDASANVRAVFGWSYRTLDPAAARLFRFLSVHPGPDISRQAAASLLGSGEEECRKALAELAASHLVMQETHERYSLHNLLSVYAIELARQHDTERALESAAFRLFDHYLHTARRAFTLLYPGWTPPDLSAPAVGATPQHISDRDHALAWYDVEHPVLVASALKAGQTGFTTHCWQISWTLVAYLERTGRWQACTAVCEAAMTAARYSGDLTASAHAHRWMSDLFAARGCLEEANAHLLESLSLYEKLGDDMRQATSHLAIGALLEQQKQYAEALTHEKQALRLFRSAGHTAGQSWALNAIGWFHALLGDYDDALAHCQQALVLCEDPRSEASVLDSIGFVWHQRGDYDQAINNYRAALQRRRASGDLHRQADVLMRLGDSYRARGDIRDARDAWLQAFAILDNLQHPDAGLARAKLDALEFSQCEDAHKAGIE